MQVRCDEDYSAQTVRWQGVVPAHSGHAPVCHMFDLQRQPQQVGWHHRKITFLVSHLMYQVTISRVKVEVLPLLVLSSDRFGKDIVLRT